MNDQLSKMPNAEGIIENGDFVVMINDAKLVVRWLHTESGRILMESYEGPQEELPTVCVEYEKMPDGSMRVVREWVAGDRVP